MEIALVIALGLALAGLSAVLIRKWDRQNRARFPDLGASKKFIEIHREKRP